MINQESLQRELQVLEPGHLFIPDFGSFCFSGIPGTIKGLLTGEASALELPSSVLPAPGRSPRVVVLILFDAFGWHSYDRFGREFDEVRELERAGVLSKLTSQFPSTTAAHVSTLFTGEPVCSHGIYEWFYYEPRIDRVIAPLPFMLAGDSRPGSLSELGVSADQIFNVPSFAESLAAHGVRPVIFQDAKYALSAYSQHMLRGGEIVPYTTVEAGLAELNRLISKADQPSFFYFYIDRYDTAGHLTGPFTEHSMSEGRRIFRLLKSGLFPVVETSKNLTLFLTADHGQCTVDPGNVFYFNQELPELLPLLKRNKADMLIPFAGSSRDLFLHVKDAVLDEALGMLRAALSGRAIVERVSDLAGRGLFCGRPLGPELAARIGNVVILPFEGEQVYYREVGKFEALFRGHHGGLTLTELEIPLFAVCT